MFSDAEENFRHFIRQRKFWRRDARGNLELSRFTLQTKNCFPYSPPAARRARSNGEALVAKGEMYKAGQATGAPCACKRTYTERCKSAPYEHGQYVAEPNCVARRRGGEQGDAKWQSVGYELDSA